MAWLLIVIVLLSVVLGYWRWRVSEAETAQDIADAERYRVVPPPQYTATDPDYGSEIHIADDGVRVFDRGTTLINEHKPYLRRTGNWGNKMVTGTKRVSGHIISRNTYTVWFQLADGHTIKRHIRKHYVIMAAG